MRIVYKIGSRLLTCENGHLNLEQVEKLVSALAAVQLEGHELVVVSSGAVAAGMGALKMKKYPSSIVEKQAAASVGQARLMHTFESLFALKGITISQVLLTRGELHNRKRFLNARNTLTELLARRVIPIVNENDVVAVDEIIVGDNDQLAAMTSFMIQAERCVLLTDVDGVLKNPDDSATLIRRSDSVRALEPFVQAKKSAVSTGGMHTKLLAASMNSQSGIDTVITNGRQAENVAAAALAEPNGTLILAHEQTVSAWKHWLRHGAHRQGRIDIDSGAKSALTKSGKSLLPSGILAASGDFDRGDVVDICFEDKLQAIGIVQYDCETVNLIKGLSSHKIENLLQYKPRNEVVHRNDLTILHVEDIHHEHNS